MRTFYLISHLFYLSSRPTVSSTTNGASATSTALSTTLAISITASANATSPTPINSSSTTVSAQPTSTPLDPATAQDIATIHVRRLSNIVGALTNASSIPSWLSTLQPNGQWPDLDYTTGCPAQRANWPAELHWNRVSTMAGAWNGGLAGAEQYVKDPALRSNISLTMGYWFSNDFTNPACLDSGGTAKCPCGTPGLWNTNWFSNIIGTPELVSMSCLLLNDTLLPTELDHCTTITGRAYGTFDRNINGVGLLTGANTLDVAKIGIDQALLTVNLSMITDAYRRVHAELAITTTPAADGIRPDGSFGQHAGILYNGNYGKDYTNDVVDLEVEAGGTQFQATPASQTALATLFDGDRWMIYRNALTGVLHWDFSVLGRFISFPTADFTQATASILLNLTKIDALGQEWDSDTLEEFSTTLSTNGATANAGDLTGNRMFYANDYMVHRSSNYVTTLKMYSTRSRNTECTNLANPFGFHLSDGALRTYLQGDEYEDIAAAMDWNLVPGVTVDYGATPLNCAQTKFVGIENFVVGVAAMRYTNPLTRQLHWQKTWFFLADDVQLVMVANISSASNATVVSVLDQRRHASAIVLDGTRTVTDSSFAQHDVRAQSLWHGDVGYIFSAPASSFSLSLQVEEKYGNWTAIGTSTQPPETVDLFSAWIVHDAPNVSLAYTIFPGTNLDTFIDKSSSSQVHGIQNDAFISAVLDESASTVMAVFWTAGGGSFSVGQNSPATFTISTNNAAALIFNWDSGNVTVSDPTQTLSAVSVTLSAGGGSMPSRWGGGVSKTVIFALPIGGFAGSSVSQNVYQ
ncbi:polysaccharide lyase family 8 protein [Mycena rosella]|uniref:Polysaccharide lyase family 8 protein n=1 Tax=Mycena rosella TaxID=1033263 RepID=A0AAD7DGU2_MYCRO|nr:polysaccharide lyase family 8 protein [Mycena rosella]